MYAIETHSLSKAFNGMYAVDNLDLHVPEGAIYGFIGENEAADAQTFTNAWRVLEMVQGGAVGMDLMVLAHFGGSPWRLCSGSRGSPLWNGDRCSRCCATWAARCGSRAGESRSTSL
jgi:hypothetical protein